MLHVFNTLELLSFDKISEALLKQISVYEGMIHIKIIVRRVNQIN